jgi:hypothetical protein
VSTEAVARPPVTSWRQILTIAGAAVLTALALAPVVVGYVAGTAVYALRWLAAAVAVGYAAGNRREGADT